MQRKKSRMNEISKCEDQVRGHHNRGVFTLPRPLRADHVKYSILS